MQPSPTCLKACAANCKSNNRVERLEMREKTYNLITHMKSIIKLVLIIFIVHFQNPSVFGQQWSGNNNTNDPIGRIGRVGVGTLSPNPNSSLDVVSSLGTAPLRVQGLGTSVINRTLIELVHPSFRWLIQSDAGGNPEFIIFDEFNQPKFNVLAIDRLSGNVGFGLDAIQNTRLAIDGNFGQVSSGQFGSLSQGNIRWSALGLSPVPEVGQPNNFSNPYGIRLQWDSDFAIFQLRDQGSNRKDAEIIFGDDLNDRFRIVFIDNVGSRQTLLTLNPSTNNIEAKGIVTQEITVDKIQD